MKNRPLNMSPLTYIEKQKRTITGLRLSIACFKKLIARYADEIRTRKKDGLRNVSYIKKLRTESATLRNVWHRAAHIIKSQEDAVRIQDTCIKELRDRIARFDAEYETARRIQDNVEREAARLEKVVQAMLQENARLTADVETRKKIADSMKMACEKAMDQAMNVVQEQARENLRDCELVIKTRKELGDQNAHLMRVIQQRDELINEQGQHIKELEEKIAKREQQLEGWEILACRCAVLKCADRVPFQACIPYLPWSSSSRLTPAPSCAMATTEDAS